MQKNCYRLGIVGCLLPGARFFFVHLCVHYLFTVICMKKSRRHLVGRSYEQRVSTVLSIYEQHERSGLSNREILRRYIWPVCPICERTFYNIINASADPQLTERREELSRQLSLPF